MASAVKLPAGSFLVGLAFADAAAGEAEQRQAVNRSTSCSMAKPSNVVSPWLIIQVGLEHNRLRTEAKEPRQALLVQFILVDAFPDLGPGGRGPARCPGRAEWARVPKHHPQRQAQISTQQCLVRLVGRAAPAPGPR